MATNAAVVHIRLNATGFRRAAWVLGQTLAGFGDALHGRPVRPMSPLPRDLFPGTAREYRAARRRYGRELWPTASVQPSTCRPGRRRPALETALVVPSGGTWNEDARPASDPHRTITSRDSYAVAELPLSFVTELRGGGSDARPVTHPASTFTASGNHHALVTPYYGASTTAKPVTEPVGTLTTVDRYALIHRNNGGGPEMTTPVFEPLRTLTTAGHQSLLQQTAKPAVTARDIEAAEKMLPDVLFRMFRPLEVAAGMAFPATYDWDVRDAKGKLPTNRDLVKAMGNAVCPPCSRDLIAAVAESLNGQLVAA